MSDIHWDQSFEIGDAEIDDQHRQLVRMINELGEAIRLERGRVVLGAVIDALLLYAGAHFATEERHLDPENDRDAAAHVAEHEAFVTRVTAFRSHLEDGDGELPTKVMDFLRSWLLDHLRGTDRGLVEILDTDANP